MSIFYTNKTITMNRGDSGVVLLSILNRDDTPFALPIGMKNPAIVFSVKAETDANDLNGNMLIEEYMPIEDYTYYGYGTPDENGQMKIHGGFYPKSKTVNTEESVLDTGIIYKVLANKKYMFVVPTTTPPEYPIGLTKREYAFAVPLVFEPAFTDRLSPGTYTYSVTLLDSTSPIRRTEGEGDNAITVTDFDGFLKNVTLKQDLFGSQKLILGDSPIARVHGDPIRRIYYIKPCSEESVANATASEITTGNVTNIVLPPVYIATAEQLGGVIVGQTLQVDFRGVLNVSKTITDEIVDLYAKIGDMTQLTTEHKDTLVGAINEVDEHTDANKAEIGDLSVLTTGEKTTLVGAINEVDNHADNAIGAANNAVATANNAVATANEAKTKAQTAETNANSALDTANAANATAGEAKAIAQGSQRAIGFATLKAAITALNGYDNSQLKVGDNVYIVETGVPDLWVAAVEQNSVAYNYTTNDAFNDDLVENTLVQVGYYKVAYLESDGKPCTVAWQNMTVAASDWVASTEFEDFAYEAKIALTDFVNFSSIPQVVFGLTEATSGNYAPICKAGDKGVYIYSKVNTAITLPTIVTFAPNVHGASMQGGGYTNKGKWVASTTYEIDDLVYTDKGQYVCIEGITSTTSPDNDTTHWQASFVATAGTTKNTLKFTGQNSDGTNVQKTFDGSASVEMAFDENDFTLTEKNGVLEVKTNATVPEALPQEASALKSGNLPTTGWTNVSAPLWQGVATFDKNGNNKTLLCNIGVKWNNRDEMPLTGWTIEYSYISNTTDRYTIGTFQKIDSLSTKGIIHGFGSDNAYPYLEIDVNGDVYGWTQYTYISGRIIYKIEQQSLSKQGYTVSDTSITANSDILMELTDDGGVKSYSMEAGKITVIRDTVPTQPIPYTYKVKQTNASGQFTLVNHFVPKVPEVPTSLPVTYKKVSGELPTTGWSPLGWEQSTFPASRPWLGIAYGKGKFVTIANSGGKGAYSTDGITWTEMTMPSTGLWAGITYGNGKFVTVKTSSDKGAYSVDGINWTETTMPSPTYRNWLGVAYGNGKFVAFTMDSSYCAYSNDGITWTATTLPATGNWRSIVYGNDKFVAVAKGTDKGAYSTDGITWTEMTLPASRNWQGITYGEGKFIAIAGSSDKGAYSTDGITWTEMTLPSSRDWFCTAYGNGKFVAIEYNGLRAAYSTDGITWLAMTTPIIRSWSGVVYGDNKFVVVSKGASVSSQNNKGLYWEVDSNKSTYIISDTFITTNTSVKMYLTDESRVKALRMSNGSITVLRDTAPTTAIPYKYEVKQTSAPGFFEVINAYMPTVLTKTSQLENDSGFIKPTEANTFTGEQTFSNENGIKTNRVHNLNGNAWYDFDGTNDRLGSLATPTIVRTSEARPKAEVPSGSATAVKELALLEDVQGSEWAVNNDNTAFPENGWYLISNMVVENYQLAPFIARVTSRNNKLVIVTQDLEGHDVTLAMTIGSDRKFADAIRVHTYTIAVTAVTAASTALSITTLLADGQFSFDYKLLY